ncbi:MAG: peptide MFS transporter [Sphingomonadaceae bacterium]|nr:peptide MFS transporter [Sphingomonadaceae bacterium]
MASVAAGAGTDTGRGGLEGQPRGLWVLAGTEFWERVSFHGMQALLVLYMVEQLLLPGHAEHVAGLAAVRGAVEAATGPLSAQAFASQLFGLYVGFVYFTPAIGGWIGDRVIGRRAAVVVGGLLMAAGHLSLAFDKTFLAALGLLVAGAGLLRGNLLAEVGALYTPQDRRRAEGVQLYYTGINVGAFVAPIATGALGQAYGWHAGFAFAAGGMLIGVAIYLAGRGAVPAQQHGARGEQRPLTPAERRSVGRLAVLGLIAVSYWTAQTQVWNTYNIWARDHLDRVIGAFTMPVPWLQGFDALAPVLMLPFVLRWWRVRAQTGRESGELTKAAIGCLLFALGMAWLGAAGAGRVPLLWGIAFHMVSNLGWIYFNPVVLAVFTRAAPAPRAATVIACYQLSVFVGSIVSGRLGGFYERWGPADFWFVHAGIAAAGSVAVLALRGWLRRALG